MSALHVWYLLTRNKKSICVFLVCVLQTLLVFQNETIAIMENIDFKIQATLQFIE